MIARLQAADVDCLLSLPMLAELRPDEVRALMAEAAVTTYAEESLLFSAGDPAERFFAVVEGYVRLFALSNDGHETTIEVIGVGASFAEAAIFATGRYPVNAEVAAGSRLVSVRDTALMRLLRDDPDLALRMLGCLHRWQIRLMQELLQLKAQTPGRRLAWYLLDLLEQTPGATSVALPHRKGVIAARIGITPESLSRALARLGRLGVETEGNVVKIPDPEALRRFCAR
ncbi:MAG TPA: cyclic nucleotide-binding domain-containing protein [Rhodospirillales bacterium]|nr:cyclic nucleotide-binding domain-containing protein [Rhodospirillales bacterium]